MTGSETVLPYRRRLMSWRAYALPAALWVVATVLLLRVGHGGMTTFNVVFSVVAPTMIFGIWLLTVWSIDRYGAMSIDGGQLRVGRTRVPLAVLDREWLLALARAEAPSAFQRFARSAGAVQVGGISTLNPAQGRLIGGAFAVPLGADQMTLRKTNGEMITMPVKDRPEAVAALLEAVESP